MRRPYMAGAPKRNRARLRALKKGPGKQICRRLRRHKSPRLPVARLEAVPSSRQACAPTEAAKCAAPEATAREPERCSFGAVRVGALLGRVRLHLQTDRFLAVHRGDAVWEAGCLQAALAVAEIVSEMKEGEMAAALPSSQLQSHPSECGGSGTRKTLFSAASTRSGGRLTRTANLRGGADGSAILAAGSGRGGR